MQQARFSSAAMLMAGCVLLVSSAHLLAQAYPAKPVRVIVGFTAGGATDIVGRLIAQKLSEATGQSFVVENRPGASATIAAEFVARAAPDGYTLLIASTTSHSTRERITRFRWCRAETPALGLSPFFH